MCAIDYADETFAIYNVWDRKALKPHKCTECGRNIGKGEAYQLAKGLTPGYGWSQAKVCAHCRVSVRWLTAECGGYLMAGLLEEVEEHADEYRQIGLWRLVVGQRRKWKRFDGLGLMPVPSLPYTSEALAAWEHGLPVKLNYRTDQYEPLAAPAQVQ